MKNTKRKAEVEAAVILHNWTVESLDKKSFLALSKKPKDEQVGVLSARLNAIEKAERETFFEKGAIVVYVEKTELWKQWPDPKNDSQPFHSFNDWMGSGGETCRTSRYDARTFVLETSDLPEDEVKKIARKNTKIFLKIPKHRRKDPAVLKAAQDGTKKQFLDFVDEHVPEAHLEPLKALTFNLERSAHVKVSDVVRKAMERYTLDTPEQAIETICIDVEEHWRFEDEQEKPKRKGAGA